MSRIALALLLAAAAGNAHPCTCSIGNVPKKLRNHVTVFRGSVQDIIFYDAYDASGDQYIRVTFELAKQWKGQRHQNQLLTVYNAASCDGYRFQKGETYLVYAYEEGDHLNAWWCGGVVSETEAKDAFDSEVRQLDKLRP